MEMRDRIIVALDLPDAAGALRIGRALAGHATRVKVGSTLFFGEGPSIIASLTDLGLEVFLDLKLHDIPHQVAGACRQMIPLGIEMFTVHAGGGREMVSSAVSATAEAAQAAGVERPRVLAVTVLTSLGADALRETGVEHDPDVQVETLAALALEEGVDGVVCSPKEAASVRRVAGPGRLVVTPGVRPSWAERGDQARVTTPRQAIESGASHLVIGRPVTAAEDPGAAFERILAE